jgi:excisionase family DNA binding protein
MGINQTGPWAGTCAGNGQPNCLTPRASSTFEGRGSGKATDPHPDPIKRLLTVAEASRYLGISPRTLWQQTNIKEIPRITFGSGSRPSVRYDRQDLDRWVEARKRGGAA